MNIALAVVSAVAVLLAGQSARSQGESVNAARTSTEVTRWFAAVEQHKPGYNDAAVRDILSVERVTLARIRDALQHRRAEGVEAFNRLVHRAALLHFDAAMLVANGLTVNQPRPPGPSHRSPTAILTIDGGFGGFAATGVHWEFGRTLVDMTQPRAAEDRWALLWYIASSSFMANRSLLADLAPHLERARKLFPADPDILFASGCYFDAIGSPRVRPIVEGTSLPGGVRVNAPTARASWRQAEDYFRRAADARPDFAAARVRRGRLLDLLGRHDDAVRELREAIAMTSEPALLYLAALFEGAAQEALGFPRAARERYEEAARLFPNAQAPYLALSRIARERGDRAAARTAAERVFTRTATGEMDDPWWTYALFFIRDADDRLSELRKPFLTSLGADARQP